MKKTTLDKIIDELQGLYIQIGCKGKYSVAEGISLSLDIVQRFQRHAKKKSVKRK